MPDLEAMCQYDTSTDKDKSAPPLTLIASDKLSLVQDDKDFKPHTWEDIKQIIRENRLEAFMRSPSDTQRYFAWSADIKAQYGGVAKYVMTERLKWTPSAATTPRSGPLFDCVNPVPFQNTEDYTILPNDWPYGLAKGITHLIVWLKTRLELEPSEKGDITPAARAQVEAFVQKTFVEPVKCLPGNDEKILWFKNWAKLQSVPGMDHIHIMIRDVPQEVIHDWTEGEHVVR